MDRFFRITNSNKIRGGSNATLNGVGANYDQWKKCNFLPRTGIVGHLICEGQAREGVLYVLECGPGLYVPVLPSGLTEISEFEFDTKWKENYVIGHASAQDIEKAKMNEIQNMMFSQLGL